MHRHTGIYSSVATMLLLLKAGKGSLICLFWQLNHGVDIPAYLLLTTNKAHFHPLFYRLRIDMPIYPKREYYGQ